LSDNPIDTLEDIVQKGIDATGADVEIDHESFQKAREFLEYNPALDNYKLPYKQNRIAEIAEAMKGTEYENE